ncbi:MAG: hypothetical protein Q8N56_02090 [bacterium]|nr:hypothetical protein [bacterium]
MARKIETASPYLLILLLLGLMIGFNYWSSRIRAAGVSTSVDVANSVPVINEVSLNNKTSINLTEDGTIDIMASASITDANGCTDVRDGGGVKAYVYQYSTYSASTSHDDNYMYDADIVSCSWQSTTGNTCAYECTASSAMQYYANPTSATASASADQWAVTVIASDSYWADTASNSYNDNDETAIDVNLLLGLSAPDASASVDYDAGGSLTAGAESNTLERGVRNSGNRAMNPLMSGTDMTGAGTIAVSHQQYNLLTFTVDSGTSLSGTPTTLDTVTPQRTSDTVGDASDDQIFWALYVPSGQAAGAYSGTNSLTAGAD